jgi:hypothetical protein
MREFHLITYDGSRTDLQVVADYCMGPYDYPHLRRSGNSQRPLAAQTRFRETEFDSASLRRGVPLQGPLPPDVKLWVSEGEQADLLPNPISWLILSDKLFKAFCKYAKDDMEIVHVPMLKRGSDERVDGYRVVNLLRVVSAVDMERSVVSRAWQPKGPIIVSKFAFDENRVPERIHIFRPAESLSDVVISDTVANDVKTWANGLSLIPTTTV